MGTGLLALLLAAGSLAVPAAGAANPTPTGVPEEHLVATDQAELPAPSPTDLIKQDRFTAVGAVRVNGATVMVGTEGTGAEAVSKVVALDDWGSTVWTCVLGPASVIRVDKVVVHGGEGVTVAGVITSSVTTANSCIGALTPVTTSDGFVATIDGTGFVATAGLIEVPAPATVDALMTVADESAGIEQIPPEATSSTPKSPAELAAPAADAALATVTTDIVATDTDTDTTITANPATATATVATHGRVDRVEALTSDIAERLTVVVTRPDAPPFLARLESSGTVTWSRVLPPWARIGSLVLSGERLAVSWVSGWRPTVVAFEANTGSLLLISHVGWATSHYYRLGAVIGDAPLLAGDPDGGIVATQTSHCSCLQFVKPSGSVDSYSYTRVAAWVVGGRDAQVRYLSNDISSVTAQVVTDTELVLAAQYYDDGSRTGVVGLRREGNTNKLWNRPIQSDTTTTNVALAIDRTGGRLVGVTDGTVILAEKPPSFAEVVPTASFAVLVHRGDGSLPRMPEPTRTGPAWALGNVADFAGSATDRFGNLFVAGSFVGETSVQSTTGLPLHVAAANSRTQAVYVARYAPDGRATNVRVIATSAGVADITTDTNGSVYVLLSGSDMTIPTAVSILRPHAYLVLEELGPDLIERSVTAVLQDAAYSAYPRIATNPSGSVAVLAANTVTMIDPKGEVTSHRPATSATDIALADDGTVYEVANSQTPLRALAPDGTVLWSVFSLARISVASIALTTNGDIVIGASTPVATVVGPIGHRVFVARGGAFVARFDLQGNPRWATSVRPNSTNSYYYYYDGRTVLPGADGTITAAGFDYATNRSRSTTLSPDGYVLADLALGSFYGSRYRLDAVGGLNVTGGYSWDTTFGDGDGAIRLPRPQLNSTYVAHWGPTTPVAAGTIDVTATYEGSPSAGVRIGITATTDRQIAIRWATSDADGHVHFDDVAPGSYRVASYDPEGRFERGWYNGVTSFNAATDVTVVPGGSASIAMALLVLPQAAITGKVTDAGGAPIDHVTVQLFSPDGFVRSTTTGAAGGYLFTGIRSGDYWVRFVDNRGRFIASWYRSEGTTESRTTLTVDDSVLRADGSLKERGIDLGVDTTFTTPTVRAGSTFILSVDVRNDGSDAASNPELMLDLPAGLHLVKAESPGGQWHDGRLTMTSMKPGTSAYAMASVAVDSDMNPQTTSLTVSITAGGHDNNLANNRSIHELRVIDGPAPDGLWAQTIRGSGEAVTYGIATDHDGNTYAGGYFRGTVTIGSGDHTVTWTNDRPIPDMWFAKFTSNGRMVWARRGRGFQRMDPTAGGIAIGPDGSLYVTGFFEGSAVFGDGDDAVVMQAPWGTAMFLLKFTPDGRIQWAQQRGYNAKGWTVAVGPDGNISVAGQEYVCTNYYYSNCTFGGFVATYSPNGSSVRALQQIDSSLRAGAMARNLDIDDDGALYVVGTVGQSMVFGKGTPQQTTLHTRGGYDGWLAIYEADGSLRSVTQVGGVGEDEKLSGVTVAADGDVYVTGHLATDAQIGAGTGAADSGLTEGGYLIRLAPSGASRWVRPLGANVRQVVTDRFGALYVMGGFGAENPIDSALGGDDLKAWGAEDAYLAKFYPNGNLAWITRGGGPSRDVAFTAAVDDEGLLHLAGSTLATSVWCIGPDESIAQAQGTNANAFVATCAPPRDAESDWHDSDVDVDADDDEIETGDHETTTTVTVTVENHGPKSAESGLVDLDLPSGAVLDRLDATSGSVEGDKWRCDALAAGTSASVVATILLPPQATPTEVVIGAHFEQSDLTPWNNDAEATISIVAPTPPAPASASSSAAPELSTEPSASPTTVETMPVTVVAPPSAVAAASDSATIPPTTTARSWPALVLAPLEPAADPSVPATEPGTSSTTAGEPSHPKIHVSTTTSPSGAASLEERPSTGGDEANGNQPTGARFKAKRPSAADSSPGEHENAATVPTGSGGRSGGSWWFAALLAVGLVASGGLFRRRGVARAAR